MLNMEMCNTKYAEIVKSFSMAEDLMGKGDCDEAIAKLEVVANQILDEIFEIDEDYSKGNISDKVEFLFIKGIVQNEISEDPEMISFKELFFIANVIETMGFSDTGYEREISRCMSLVFKWILWFNKKYVDKEVDRVIYDSNFISKCSYDGNNFIVEYDMYEDPINKNKKNGDLIYKRYKGKLENGILSGKGRLDFYGKHCYRGDFKNGLIDGTGSLKNKYGARFEGKFKEGFLNGIVIISNKKGYCFANGEVSDRELSIDGENRKVQLLKGVINYSGDWTFKGYSILNYEKNILTLDNIDRFAVKEEDRAFTPIMGVLNYPTGDVFKGVFGINGYNVCWGELKECTGRTLRGYFKIKNNKYELVPLLKHKVLDIDGKIGVLGAKYFVLRDNDELLYCEDGIDIKGMLTGLCEFRDAKTNILKISGTMALGVRFGEWKEKGHKYYLIGPSKKEINCDDLYMDEIEMHNLMDENVESLLKSLQDKYDKIQYFSNLDSCMKSIVLSGIDEDRRVDYKNIMRKYLIDINECSVLNPQDEYDKLLISMNEGDVYEGGMYDYKLHGQGTVVKKDEWRIFGSWIEGLANGKFVFENLRENKSQKLYYIDGNRVSFFDYMLKCKKRKVG